MNHNTRREFMIRRGVRAAILAGGTLAVALTGVAAHAQALEEITVTARKRVENLQDVPMTVQAFTSENIERQGIRNIQDVAKLTPGLSWDKGFAPQDTRPNIRGLPSTRGRPPIGILLDGVDVSSESIATAGGSSLMNLKLVDVERIEVVKGPQSALYGRVAFGGAINYVSKKPTFEKIEGNVLADVATDGLYEVRGAINVPIVPDVAALRVNALYSKFDGFYENEISGNTIGGWETKGVSAALRMQSSEKNDWILRLSYSQDDAEPRASYYFGQAVAGRNSILSLPAGTVGLRLGAPPGATSGGSVMPATIPYPLLGEVPTVKGVQLSVDPLTGKDYEGGELKSFIANLQGEVDLGFATLNSFTGFTDADALSRSDADFYALPSAAVTLPTPGTAEPLNALSVTDIDSKIKQFSQEFRLGDLTDAKFRWAAGVLYWKENYDSYNASIFISGAARRPPGTPAGWSAARELQVRGQLPKGDLNTRDTTHKSVYGVLEYSFTPQWSLSTEARYAKEDFSYIFGRPLQLVTTAGTGVPLIPAFYRPINTVPVPFQEYVGSVFTPKSNTTFFAPKAVLNWKPTDDALVYLSFSKGVKPAGFLNVAVVTDANDARYNPEKLQNYEIGFKSSWLDRRLTLNGAYFHMIYKDRIAQLLVPDARTTQGTSTLVRNQGEARVDGVELELAAAVTDGITLNAAATFMNPRLTESEVPNTSSLGVAQAGNCRLGTVGPLQVCFTNFNGNQIESASKLALTASIDYKTTLSNGWELTSQVAAQYRSKRYLGPDNTIWLPAYTNVDLQLGVAKDQWSVLGYVTNAFDQDKPTSGQTYGDPFLTNPAVFPPVLAYTSYAADKRQFGVRVGYKF